MSKEIKDFLNQFMNQPAPVKTNDDNAASTSTVEEPAAVKSAKPKTEKKAPAAAQPKAAKMENPAKIGEEKAATPPKATVTAEIEEKSVPEKPKTAKSTANLRTFLDNLDDKKYSYNRKKNLQIDDQLYNILNLLKQHEDVKSIATLLNAIIDKFVEENKEELKRVFSKNPLA